jgi:hypothetical protein
MVYTPKWSDALENSVHLTPLNIVSAGALETISEPMARAANTFIVTSLPGMTHALEVQAARPRVAALAVDLVGHSTRDHQLLRLGSTTIDALDLGVLRFFERVARSGILCDINAVCLRLLGCETATSPSGQRTMRLLTSVLKIPVYGTRKRIMRTHYTERGFHPLFSACQRPSGVLATSSLMGLGPGIGDPLGERQTGFQHVLVEAAQLRACRQPD